MFCPPPGVFCEGVFCVYETSKSFWGYKIERKPSRLSAKIYLGKKHPKNIRYLNCDSIYEFPKTVRFTNLETRYKLKELRKVVLAFSAKAQGQRWIEVDMCEIPDYDSCTKEQLENRKNPMYHKKLKDAIARRQLAAMVSDKDEVRKQEQIIEKIKKAMGYHDRVNNNQQQYMTKVNNTKPYQGGGCSPR